MRELDKILESYTPEYEVPLSFLEVPFTIRTNSEALARKLKAYFSSWDCKPRGETGHIIHAVIGEGIVNNDKLVDVIRRPGKRVKEAYYNASDGMVILKKRTGVVVYLNDNERYVVGRLVENFNQLVNQIDEIFVQHYLFNDYVLLHASAVKNASGQALVFCSESGTGKSTVAVALLEKGFTFLSNDRVLVKRQAGEVDVIGVPKKPRVNPGTILAIPSLHVMLPEADRQRYAAMNRHELWELERKYDVEVEAIFGKGTLGLRGKAAALYLLGWQRDGSGLNTEPLPGEEAFTLLQPNVLNPNTVYKKEHDKKQLDQLVRQVLGKTPSFRVSGGVNIRGLSDLLSERWTA